jgi:hypothetical protein
MKKLIFALFVAAAIFAGCGVKSDEKEKISAMSKEDAVAEEKAMADSVATPGDYNKNEGADVTDKDREGQKKTEVPAIRQDTPQAWDSAFVKRNSNRKLIKTANLVFEVSSVEKATSNIEYISNVYGGFILSSGIRATTSQTITQRINKDTVLETGVRSIENNITLRVPEFFLDTVLFHFSKIWTELNERTVNAQDVTIDFMANELRARMYQRTATNMNQAAQNNQRKLDDVVNAQETAAQYLESTIQKKIENLTLQDKIDYATITLRVYQDNVLYKKKKVSYELDAYEPGFGSQFVDSLSFGWKIILEVILFFTKAWSILLIMLCIFLVIYLPIRYTIKRKKQIK